MQHTGSHQCDLRERALLVRRMCSPVLHKLKLVDLTFPLVAIVIRLEAIAWRPSLLDWRPTLLGWRASLLGWRPLSRPFLPLLSQVLQRHVPRDMSLHSAAIQFQFVPRLEIGSQAVVQSALGSVLDVVCC